MRAFPTPALPRSFRTIAITAATLAAAACGDRAPTAAESRALLTPATPRITAITPAALVPGEAARITGANLAPADAPLTVTIAGVEARVTAASPTAIDLVVPCVPSGAAEVRVARGALGSEAVVHPLRVRRHALAPGQAAILERAEQASCNELAAAEGDARYLVAVYNTSPSPAASASFLLAGRPIPAAPRPGAHAAAAAAPGAMDAHGRILEANARRYERLRARFGTGARRGPAANVASSPAPPPATRTFRVADIYAGDCTSWFPVTATRVYHGGRVAIYEDDANPVHSSRDPRMAAHYRAIGEQYNADMDPVLTAAFGDVLRRDAELDGDGTLVLLFTRALPDRFPGVGGFVVSCDQFPNDEDAPRPMNTASNVGEIVYLDVPTDPGTGYFSRTPDLWYRSIRTAVMHEAKHVASMAARIANGAEWFAPWLEEGTARHAEELWARRALYDVPWKGNTGYGGADAPGGIYCDLRPTDPACLASDPRRPAIGMWHHFALLYRHMANPSRLSPFGPSAHDNGGFYYGASWSLVRYAADRHAASEEAFFRALTDARTSGAANLAEAAGVGMERLMGGWALSLVLDDHPALAAPADDVRMDTWNLADVYGGLQAQYPATYTRPWRVMPRPVAFGAFAPLPAEGVVGGGVAYYELRGPMAGPQLLALAGADGGPPAAGLRVAIARIE